MLLSIILLFKLVSSCSDQNCASCPTSATICGNCNSPYILMGSICVLQCNSGQYADVINSVLQCLNCYQTCLSCQNGMPNGCTLCSQPRVLNCGQCLDQIVDSTCKDCSSQCLSCYGLTPTECYQCLPPYYYTQYLQSCTLTCPSPYFGDTNTQQCNKTCPSGTWGQPTSRICQSNCPDPYFEDQLTTNCVMICPTKTFASQRQCVVCNNSCETCNGSGADMCIMCSEGNYKSKGLCGECPVDQFSNADLRICVDYVQYSLSLLDAIDSKIVFQLSFNQQINSTSLIPDEQITVQNVDSSVYQLYSNEILTNQQYVVTIQFDISHRSTDVICNFNNSISSRIGTPVNYNNSIQNLQIPPQFIIATNEEQTEYINKILIIVFLSCYAFILLICILVRTQNRMFFLIYCNLQTIQYSILLNFTFATLTFTSLQLLDIVNFKMPVIGIRTEGSTIYFFNTPIENQYPQNDFYLQAGYYYSFIANGGLQLFALIIISWILWLIFYISHQVFQINNKIDKQQIFRKLNQFSNELLVRIHEICFYPLMVMFLLQMWGFDFSSRINIGSFCIAIIVFLYYLLYFRNVYQSQFDEQQEDNKYFIFFQDFKKGNDLKKNFQFIIYSNKLAYILCLVLLNNYPYFQFSLALSTQVVYFGLILFKQPFLRQIMNITAIFEQLLTIGLLLTELLLQIEYEKSATQITIDNTIVNNYYKNGFAFMIMLQILLGTYLIAFIYNKLQEYLRFLDKKPNWGRNFLSKMEKMVFSDKGQVQEMELANNISG